MASDMSDRSVRLQCSNNSNAIRDYVLRKCPIGQIGHMCQMHDDFVHPL